MINTIDMAMTLIEYRDATDTHPRVGLLNGPHTGAARWGRDGKLKTPPPSARFPKRWKCKSA